MYCKIVQLGKEGSCQPLFCAVLAPWHISQEVHLPSGRSRTRRLPHCSCQPDGGSRLRRSYVLFFLFGNSHFICMCTLHLELGPNRIRSGNITIEAKSIQLHFTICRCLNLIQKSGESVFTTIHHVILVLLRRRLTVTGATS